MDRVGMDNLGAHLSELLLGVKRSWRRRPWRTVNTLVMLAMRKRIGYGGVVFLGGAVEIDPTFYPPESFIPRGCALRGGG